MTEIKKAIQFEFASKRKSPEKLLIVGHPKIGKTEACASLPNSVVLDMQSGTRYAPGKSIDIIQLAMKNGISRLDMFAHACQMLKKNPPDYLTVDTATDIETLAWDLALIKYKASAVGKNYKGDEVKTLPNGGGYLWMQMAMEELLDMLNGCYTKSLLFTIHPKNSSIMKEGRDLSARDINLTGKLKTIFTGEMDAIGFLYRNKGTNENVISFKSDERDLSTGARPKHLRGQEFVLSNLKEDGTLECFWDKIFID